MHLRTAFLVLLMVPLLSSCATYDRMNRKDSCDRTIKSYNRMIRMYEAEKAALVFVDSKQRQAFDKTAESLRRRGITWADFRILAMECLPEQLKAEATVEFDYFIMPDNRLKTVTDRQSWVYREGSGDDPSGRKGWLLVSPLPEFK